MRLPVRARRPGFIASLACVAACVVGCASDQSAAYQVARALVRPNADLDARPLNPQLHYLRVTSNGKAALMVLGYVDQDAVGRPVQVWYSAMGEVLRLQDGRLAGLVGTPIEWRSVGWPAGVPAWAAAAKGELTYARVRDEMPGYRLQWQEDLRLSPLAVPSDTALQGMLPAQLNWFAERAVDGRTAPARYGVQLGSGDEGRAEVVYGEQCLGPDLCLAWQTWPPSGHQRPATP